MRKKLFGMKDLAEFFGVSTSTISRALNPLQQHLISSDLVTKIKEKAKEVNFTINPHASSLKSSKTKMIGVVIA
ncbi:MAG: LacI family DNA-binding transcriptional regulator, partial [Paracoccaceae bacterium]|nr:LacI family DNA-binding transcriptional regulator [Paracoccaceae bacterium]